MMLPDRRLLLLTAASLVLGCCHAFIVIPKHSSSASSCTKLSVINFDALFGGKPNPPPPPEPEEPTVTYDLAVVGAGVVGVQAALLAAQAPYQQNVILIDAPRGKFRQTNPSARTIKPN